MQELRSAIRAEASIPAVRAVKLVSDVMPRVWKAVDTMRASRKSSVYLSWNEATDIVMTPDCLDGYAEWAFSTVGRTFVPKNVENSRGFRMGKLIMATAGWRDVQAVHPLSSNKAASLREQDAGRISHSCLKGLPQDSLYISMPLRIADAAGFFVCYDKDKIGGNWLLVLDLLVINSDGIPIFNYAVSILDCMPMSGLINALADGLYENPDPHGTESQVLMIPKPSRADFDAHLIPEIHLMLNAVRYVVGLTEEMG